MWGRKCDAFFQSTGRLTSLPRQLWHVHESQPNDYQPAGPRIGAEYPLVRVGFPVTNACRPDVTFSLTALPCFAASISSGIGRGVLNGAGSPLPDRPAMRPLDTSAAEPLANWRLVSMNGSYLRPNNRLDLWSGDLIPKIPRIQVCFGGVLERASS